MDALPDIDAVEETIVVIRGQRVMLDADLAALYRVPTKRLNQQARRNSARFPPDFMFQLEAHERDKLMRSQSATALSRTRAAPSNRLQIATGSQRHRDPASLPLAFTEHGCLMLANVLRSGRAVEVSVLIVRAFVRILVTHDGAILKLLAEIRRLTRFPEGPGRGIGFTAEWPEGT